MIPDPSLVSFVIEGGHTLSIGLNLTSFVPSQALVERHAEIINLMQKELQVDQSLEVIARLAASPLELLGEEPFIN